MLRSLRRNDTTPALADLNLNTVELLQPVPVTARTIDEGWLQTLIYTNPTLLPTGEVRPDAGHLIPIGREIGVESGRIDCLYVSPTGTLTLVETKLWTNADARREVIAQIIQYAEELSRWTYEDLDKTALTHTGKRLWDLVASDAADLGYREQEFQDAVSQKLEHADFLLLIVGDGIKRGVQNMAAFLQQTPHLHFTLALVELRLYQHPGDQRLLVVPSIVARVEEVQRAVVRVTYRSEEKPRVDVVLNEPTADEPGKKRRQPFEEEEFLEKFRSHKRNNADSIACLERIYDLVNNDPSLEIRYNLGSISIIYPRLNSKIGEASLLTIGPVGVAKFHTSSCRRNLTRRFGEEEAERIHKPYQEALLTILGPDVIKNEMSVTRGNSHLAKAYAQVETLLNAISTIARDMDTLTAATGEDE